MCSSLIQSEPSLSLPPSWHLSPQSLKPLAYKSNPLPSLIITILYAKLPCHFEITSHPKQSYNAKLRVQKLLICYYNLSSISTIEASLSTLSIHPKSSLSNRLIPTTKKDLIERTNLWFTFSFESFSFVYLEVMLVFVNANAFLSLD